MTLTTRAEHEADDRARAAYDSADVNPYDIAEGVLADGGDPHEAADEAREAMLDATGCDAAADRAAMNARGYAEELVEDE